MFGPSSQVARSVRVVQDHSESLIGLRQQHRDRCLTPAPAPTCMLTGWSSAPAGRRLSRQAASGRLVRRWLVVLIGGELKQR